MQYRYRFFPIVLLAVLAACASRSNSGSQSVGARGPAFDVATLISGTYRLQNRGDSNLRLDISSTGGVGSELELLATASGRYAGRNVNEQGVIVLETAGPDVRMSIIPHFGEPVTVLSPNLTEFSQSELGSACTLHLQSDEQGWAGATEGKGSCVRAVGGAVGQWQVEILPGTIRFSDPGTRQVLVFQKTSSDRVGR
ncbi:MAG TPA: hypothetical protein VHC97_03485 [Thermoanaerobaculia bacterium]|jgi:hypothetical protein|nr:hypothetical protein [Thermoanaerobaculia bacterium]